MTSLADIDVSVIYDCLEGVGVVGVSVLVLNEVVAGWRLIREAIVGGVSGSDVVYINCYETAHDQIVERDWQEAIEHDNWLSDGEDAMREERHPGI